MQLHDATIAAGQNQEVPRFARFSFEVGEGKNTFAVDGVGAFQRFTDGKIGFSEGNSYYGSDDGIDPHSRVIQRARARVRVWVDNTAHCFPIDGNVRDAFLLLYSTSPAFLKNVEKIHLLVPR